MKAMKAMKALKYRKPGSLEAIEWELASTDINNRYHSPWKTICEAVRTQGEPKKLVFPFPMFVCGACGAKEKIMYKRGTFYFCTTCEGECQASRSAPAC